jgi:hypothetical protein
MMVAPSGVMLFGDGFGGSGMIFNISIYSICRSPGQQKSINSPADEGLAATDAHGFGGLSKCFPLLWQEEGRDLDVLFV